MRGILPVLLIGFGLYLLRDYVFKSKKDEQKWGDYGDRANAPMFATALSETSFRPDEFNARDDFETETRISAWKNRA